MLGRELFRALLLGSALLLPAVGACSSDDEPSTLPPLPSGSAASSTPSPTYSVPPFPATKAGAADFVRLYLKTANEAQTTGHTERLATLSSPECAPCHRYIRSVIRYWQEGRVVGGEIVARFVEVALMTATDSTVTVIADEAAVRIYNHSGDIIREAPSSENTALTYRLTRVHHGWLVSTYRTEDS
jgi:hypothetical protein